MKKLFLIGLATAAMLTGCSNDETVEATQSKAIGFSNAFVNNGTRSIVDPSFKTTSLKNFAVYGFTQNGKIFDGTEVKQTMTEGEGQGDWNYAPTQYWVPGNTYTFGAIAPYSVKANVSNVTLPTNATKVEMEVAFTNTDDNQVDLLHAEPKQISGAEVTDTYATPVAMTFNHQLSKVKFSFENAVGEGYDVKVTNVKITNAYTNGTLIVAAGGNSWSAQAANTLTLDFGHVVADDATTNEAAAIANGTTLESYNEKLMIPMNNTAEYTVTFTAELLQKETSLGEFEHEVTIKDVEFRLGYCYDFKAILTRDNIVDPGKPLKPIEFTVYEIAGWNETELDQELEVSTTQN